MPHPTLFPNWGPLGIEHIAAAAVFGAWYVWAELEARGFASS